MTIFLGVVFLAFFCLESGAAHLKKQSTGSSTSTPTVDQAAIDQAAKIFQATNGILPQGFTLYGNQALTSATGDWTLTLQQSDANLVLRNVATGSVTWKSGILDNSGSPSMTLQGDGNLVISNAAGNPIWSSKSVAPAGEEVSGWVLWVQDDGNVVIYDGEGRPRWAVTGLAKISH